MDNHAVAANPAVTLSVARQSRLSATDSGLPRRFAPRNDGVAMSQPKHYNDLIM